MHTLTVVSNTREQKLYSTFKENIFKNETFWLNPYESNNYMDDIKIYISDETDIYAGCSFNIDRHLLRQEGIKNIIVHEWLMLDYKDDAKIMLDYLKNYASDNNCSQIILNESILVEGFTYPNSVKKGYNPLYYPLIIEELGFQKKEAEKGYTLTPINFFREAKEEGLTVNIQEIATNYKEISFNNEKIVFYIKDNYMEIMEDNINDRVWANTALNNLLNEYNLKSIALITKLPHNKLKSQYSLFNINLIQKYNCYYILIE